MYTTKELQDMCQIDNMIDKTKDFMKNAITMNVVIANSMTSFFDHITDRKFTTYTDQVKKGINHFADSTEKFIETGTINQVYANSNKN